MGLFTAINIASTGLSAQRLRMDVIANNIANATTTRSTEGDGPYRRRIVILQPRNLRTRWKSPVYPFSLRTGLGEGVRVVKIERDIRTPTRLVYDPSHPDAIPFGEKKGYVEYPNVNPIKEIVDLIEASRAYEANLQVIEGSKGIFRNSLRIMQFA